MKKIPTLFMRDFTAPSNGRYVTDEVHPACQWVLDGEGVATRKYDGTCVMFDGERWWARREVKANRQPPAGFVEVGFDDIADKAVGWEPIEQSAFAKYHDEALVLSLVNIWPGGTYELIGPKVNGNPEREPVHVLQPHAAADVLVDAPRDFDGLSRWLATFAGEGIVWHHPDGRMAKIKRKDFPS